MRELGRLGEPETRTVLWFSLVTSLFGLPWAVFAGNLHGLTLEGAAILLGVGIFGGCAQLAMTRAYRYGKTVVSANLSYSTVIFSSLFGVALWSRQAPSGWLNLAGGLFSLGILCFAGGIYVLRIFAGIHTGPLINVVPFGGFCLIGGWLALGVAGWKQR